MGGSSKNVDDINSNVRKYCSINATKNGTTLIIPGEINAEQP